MSAEGQEDTQVLRKLGETFTLGFELIGAEAVNLPDQLDTALQSKDVQEAINKALIAFATQRLAGTPTAVSSDQALALAKLIGETAGKPLGKEMIEQIKKTPHFKS